MSERSSPAERVSVPVLTLGVALALFFAYALYVSVKDDHHRQCSHLGGAWQDDGCNLHRSEPP